MTLEFYNFDFSVVNDDNNIETKVFDDGVLITFTGKENGVFFPYESGTNTLQSPIVGMFEDEAMPLVKYIVEKYKLLTLAVGDFSDATSRLVAAFFCSEDESIGDAIIEDYATLEMLVFAEEYGWSAEFIAYLETVRKAAREILCVKNSYAVGDIVKFDFCDEEMIYVLYGKVIYVDKLHAIVHIPAESKRFVCLLNRNSIPHNVVSDIIGQSIETVTDNERDEFVDMMDPYSYLAIDPFSRTWINPNSIFE